MHAATSTPPGGSDGCSEPSHLSCAERRTESPASPPGLDARETQTLHASGVTADVPQGLTPVV